MFGRPHELRARAIEAAGPVPLGVFEPDQALTPLGGESFDVLSLALDGDEIRGVAHDGLPPISEADCWREVRCSHMRRTNARACGSRIAWR